MTRSARFRPAGAPGMRRELAVVAALLALAAAGWGVTGERMGGMDEGPGTELGGLAWFMVAWPTMMAAMMLPSIAPAVVTFTQVQHDRAGGGLGPTGSTALFVAGYLAAWTFAGLLGYAAIEGMRSLEPGFLEWEQGGRYAAGGVMLGAAVYQLTPLKDRCLSECRSPSGVVGTRPPTPARAMRTGLEYGRLCVGCCWALMAALFALGVMSIAWMLFFAALIATEKLLPWRTIARRGVAIAVALLGLGAALVPGEVPGLTVPGADARMAAAETQIEDPVDPDQGRAEREAPART